MAIDRISAGNALPLITQRLDVSPATPLTPGVVMPLVPVGPFMAPAPDAGTLPAQLGQAQDALAALVKPNAGDPGLGATARDSSAMQVNQLFFTRQLVWQPPDAAQLAASWRVMVKTYGEQYAALQEHARGQHLPGTLLMAEQQPVARSSLPLDTEAWRFAVYGWAGQRLLLRVLPGGEEATAPRKRQGKVALRVELLIDDVGRVVIQMEPANDGVLLELAAQQDEALAHLRRMLPAIADCVRQAGLRLLRCRLNRVLHAQPAHAGYPMQAAAAALSLPLFQAMAEVALLLTRPPAEVAQDPAVHEAPPAPAQEEPVIVSKEVAAPKDYWGDATAEEIVLPADEPGHELLMPIEEQD
ncbi:hypothetical protein [Janthinobacterium psychrotolerans]|uniref:Hook-length control protein FliK n=1 Tax=Janthinobacterium psychrotolerans TaxID=1747903 RepID=A0A1A7C4T6_9BURK|nr:hypothetical protein [Janthinobacterium psychrotolerans]OBV40936.1 hypothetical protein ASR47_102162 [Janthinobacterium psychrotolerans]